ncbi:MAG: hypothetical protein A2V66_10950 [Ignavibacteria bacterium RBG_13_36_8]|nr:MAG: hypothetical protein A2V66_10950 [Ignavibacteria bacterium RBG_13_36_8]
MENLIGKVIQNYKIVSVLGKGGMGIVYKAYDIKLDRYVAIKILHPTIIDKANFIERFKREAKHQAQLSHPNIVTVYGFIEYLNFLGIVMEYVEGESLEKLINRKKRLHLYDVIYILKQILFAIGYAHSKGFVHRDIKPSNIILNREGVAKIMDFGISKSLLEESHTKTGAKVGTVFYMSPEQIKGQSLTHHSDIYSIGCTLYEMLTGEPPFFSENEYEAMDNHLKKNPPLVSEKLNGAPELLNKIVSRALEKDPNVRFQTCEEFANSLVELDKYLSTLNEKYYRKKKRDPKIVKRYSILAFSSFIVFMIVLSYFVYKQVFALLNSPQLNSLNKYSIESLFKDNTSNFDFKKIELIQNGISENLNCIRFADKNFGIALGDSGVVLTTHDNGNTWMRFDTIKSYSFYDAYFQENGKSFIVGEKSRFYYCENYLSSWQPLKLNDEYTLFKVYFNNLLNGYVLGGNGLILRTTDSGTNWRQVQSNTNNILYDVKFINDDIGYIVGWNGTVLKTVDKGNSWHKIESFTNKYLKSIDFWDDELGLIVGGGGSIFKTNNGGENWDLIHIEQTIGLHKVKFLSEAYIVILGSKGTLMISKNGGDHWNEIETKIFTQLNDLTINKAGRIFIVGANGVILKVF